MHVCRWNPPFFGQIALKIDDVEFVVIVQKFADLLGPLNAMFFDAGRRPFPVWRHLFCGFICGFDGGQGNINQVQLLLMKTPLLFQHFTDFWWVEVHLLT